MRPHILFSHLHRSSRNLLALISQYPAYALPEATGQSAAYRLQGTAGLCPNAGHSPVFFASA